MPIITQTDLATNIYAEIINEITRSDASIAEKAISAAESEAKMYLTRYDLVQLFGTNTVAPVINDELLKALVKDLACWHLIRLSNTGVDYGAFRTAYLDAIAVLKNIQSGQAQPQNWPYPDSSVNSIPQGDSVAWNSNPKRENYY